MKEFNFTKRSLAALPLPEKGRRATYKDTGNHRLIIRVTHTGAKAFIVRRRVQGKPERVTIGSFPDVTVEQARNRADEINAEIATGGNPNDARRALRAETTLSELHTEYLERHSRIHKRSWRKDESQFQLYLRTWARRKISSIKRAEIQALHSRVGRGSGPYAANRMLELLRAMYNKAIDWGWKGENPALRIARFKERARERFLEPDELPRFFAALAEEPNTIARDYFVIALLTGARRSNVLAMRWEDVHLSRGKWTIPDTKSGSSHTVPLVPEVIVILEHRKQQSDGPWAFPGHGKTGHLVEPKKAWARILARAEIKDLRIHDLRRSLGSWQAATGASLSIIGKTLGHKSVSTTAIYARLNIDPVREAMHTAARAIFDAAGINVGDTVVGLRRSQQ